MVFTSKGSDYSIQIQCCMPYKYSSPSQSLVEGILKEKNSGRRGIPVLDWELEKEPCAHEEYRQEMKKTHVNFRIEQAGLFVNSLYPHI